MFFPYSTDAPVYYWPWATIGLILANIGAFFGVVAGVLPFDPETGDPWVLEYGAGLWPTQWICSPFMHQGIGHLVSNMIALWAFGLVVEGKLGPARYLLVYMTIAIGESAIEQLLMLLTSEGGSLGASSAVMGVLVIAAIWAPDNSFECFYWFGWFAGTVSVPVIGIAMFYIGLDLAIALLVGGFGGGVTGSLLHLLGVAIGIPIGVTLLRSKAVDCEGWDFFTRYGWNKKQLKKEAENEAAAVKRQQETTAKRASKTLADAGHQIETYVEAGNFKAAVKLRDKMAALGDGLRLEPPTLRKLIAGLQSEQHWHDLAPLLAELIEQSPAAADGLRVQLAQVCVAKLERPGRALELLAQTNTERLNEKQLTTAKRIAQKAHAMQQQGVVELDDGGW